MEWFDPRITFHNLHDDQGLNTLIEEEKKKIWTPSLVFYNTDRTVQTTVDKESRIMVKKEGKFRINTIDDVDNVYMYKGCENPLRMQRIYHTKWYTY